MPVESLELPTDIISDIRKKERTIEFMEKEVAKMKFELQQLKQLNANTVSIQWKGSSQWCLEVDAHNPSYFLKTPAFVAKCIAWKHAVEVTRDIKNKIATTLSTMFNQGLIGRIQHNGKTYYGIPKFFKGDMTTLKREYQNWLEDLTQ